MDNLGNSEAKTLNANHFFWWLYHMVLGDGGTPISCVGGVLVHRDYYG
jgi:hypothetical protein